MLADARGHPWLIDPSAYGGHREIDLAMLRLFGGGRDRVFDAYEEASPLAEGHEERVELWQLCRCSCTPSSSAAPTAPRSSAPRVATPR